MTASGIPHIYRVELGIPNHILGKIRNRIKYDKLEDRFKIEESEDGRLLVFEVTIMLLFKEEDESNEANRTIIRRKIAEVATEAIIKSLKSEVMSTYLGVLSGVTDDLVFRWKLLDVRMPECRLQHADD